ncbi:MAG: L,D-transpeptidase [Actinobacteria bacterium]|nr:L,D-transpeptidase [Actinomycetota bacterium]
MKFFSKLVVSVVLSIVASSSLIVFASGDSSTSSTSTTSTTSTIVPTPTAAETSLLYPARALRFPEYTRLNPPLLPANSGVGRRIVYKNELQWVWVVDANNKVREAMPVSGRRGVPKPGEYQVTSQSLRSYSLDFEGVWFINMTRFAIGPAGGNIGFHEIPVKNGKPLQTEDQLGSFQGSGCLRMAPDDAKLIFNFGKPGTKVVVLP